MLKVLYEEQGGVYFSHNQERFQVSKDAVQGFEEAQSQGFHARSLRKHLHTDVIQLDPEGTSKVAVFLNFQSKLEKRGKYDLQDRNCVKTQLSFGLCLFEKIRTEVTAQKCAVNQ